METRRLFIGLDVPQEVKDRIVALPHLKLDFKSQTHPDDLHLTLRFLGHVPEERVVDIIDALSTMKKHARFTISIGGIGYYQKNDKGVLFADIEQNRKLFALEETITAQMNRLGFAEGGRAFSPHITIARLRDDRNVEEYRRKNEKSLRTSWTVTDFHLFQSENREAGEKRYTSLAGFALSPY